MVTNVLVLGRLMTRHDDGANGWPPADDKYVVASGCDIGDAIATLFNWFANDAFVVDAVNDDVEFDIVDDDVTPAPMFIAWSHVLVVISSELFAFDAANWRVLPSSNRRCNPDIFLKRFVKCLWYEMQAIELIE